MATTAKMLSKAKGKEQKAVAAEKAVEKASMGKAPMEKAGKAKARKKAPVEEDFIVETSQLCEKLTKLKALRLAMKLLEDVGENYFKFGGVLSVVQANQFWDDTTDTDGQVYGSFKEFMQGVYGMPYRKGMYLIQIYNNLVESGVAWDDVKDIGWTKLKEISGLITPENVNEWREWAMSMTTIQLIDYIKALDKVDATGESLPKESDVNKTTTITFKVHEDQKATIQSAVDKSMKANKTEFSAVALEYICMGYLEGAVGKVKKIEKPLIDVIKATNIEELFTVIEKVFPEYDITVVEK